MKQYLNRKEIKNVGPPPPIPGDYNIEQPMDVPDITKPEIVAPYPKSTRELRSLIYGTVGPTPKKISRELRGLQSQHVAYINKQVLK
jgi:hypothetical protein